MLAGQKEDENVTYVIYIFLMGIKYLIWNQIFDLSV